MKVPQLFIAVMLLLSIACSPKQNSVLNNNDSKTTMPDVAHKSISDKGMVSDVIATDDRLIQGTLSNGIQYYIQKNTKPENRAELRLAVNAGSILEDDDQKGLAHFVEHMAFNGTENFEKSELVDYLESVGTRFGPDLNAYTSFDETVYMLQVRTDSSELFDKGMLILKDWAGGVTFDHEEIDKERGVVESEWRSRLSPSQRMQNITFPIMYKGSQYSDRLPIGDPEIIRNADYEAFKRFYKDWYRPDLQAVVVVGDVDVAEVEQQIKELFGSIPAAVNPRDRTRYEVPFHKETLVAIASDEEESFTNVSLMYKHDKIHTKTNADYRESLKRNLYNNMMRGRLQELSKSADPPFVFGNTSYGGGFGEKDYYRSFAFVPEGKAEAALEALLTENRRIQLHGFTQGELERAKSTMMKNAERNLKEMDKTESRTLVMRYVYKYLEDIPTPGPNQTMDLYNKYLDGIMLDEVNTLPSKWIKDDSRVVSITGPLKKDVPLPTEATVREMLAQSDLSQPEAYVDEVATEPFFDKELSTVAITKSEFIKEIDAEYLQLENGIQVYLKKTDFKNDEILVSASSPGGTSLYTDDQYFDASNASSLVREAGLGNFSTTQLDKMMAGKTVRMSPYIGTYAEGFNGAASPDDIEILFQMVYQYFYNPRVDEEAFTSFKNKQKGIFKNLMSNPEYYFSDRVNKLKYNNHPRVGFPSVEDWDKIDYVKAMEYYNERFADASDFTFFIVGNYDETTIKQQIQTYLGNLPSINREETWKDVGIKAVEGGVTDKVTNGIAPKTNVHMYWHGDFDYNKDNNYVMNSSLAYLRIKLREKLREDLGGVYGVRVSGGGTKKPREEYGITVSFNADPPMADKLIRAAKEVLAVAAKEGPSEEDMTKVKETQKQSRVKDLQQNRFWSSQLSSGHENGRDFSGISLEAVESQISNLTADQIKAAVGKYFDNKNFIQILMVPDSSADTIKP
jgi:zinc protease